METYSCENCGAEYPLSPEDMEDLASGRLITAWCRACAPKEWRGTPAIAEAEMYAETSDGRTYGAWVRGGIGPEDLRNAGYVPVESDSHNWERPGYHASLIQRPTGDIHLMIVCADEPAVYAIGIDGYLPHGDRP
jgi:hypothetical protein